jgi:hypothetical protein
VQLNASNIGDQAQSFFASNQKLQIGDKKFSVNDSAAFWTQSMNVEINPDNRIQAVVSFDVPPGTSDGGVLTKLLRRLSISLVSLFSRSYLP